MGEVGHAMEMDQEQKVAARMNSLGIIVRMTVLHVGMNVS